MCELEYSEAARHIKCRECGEKLYAPQKGNDFEVFICRTCEQKSFSDGVRAGSSGILEQYEKMGWLIPKLELVCSDCGGKILTSHKGGLLEIHPCSHCVAKSFMDGKREGRKEMSGCV